MTQSGRPFSLSAVALIRPPLVRPRAHLTGLETFPPLQLAGLAGVLAAEGIDVQIIDAQESIVATLLPDGRSVIVGDMIPVLLKRIPAATPLICISCMYTHAWFHDQLLIRAIREHFPAIPIVIGGEHASAFGREILATCPEVDAVVVGEGEHALEALARGVLSSEKILSKMPAGIPGVLTRSESPLQPGLRITDLDSLPPPHWAGVRLELYFERGSGITQKSKRSLPIIASRGCPHSCHFCTASQMWGSQWRHRSVNSILREMKDAHINFGVTHFDFLDLSIATDIQWLRNLCEALIQNEVKFTWALPVGTRAELLDDDLIKKMAASGLTHILYSVESASPRTLLEINKRLSLRKLTRCIRKTVQVGISVKLVFINGFPGQRLGDLLYNWVYLLKMAWTGVQDVVCLAFVPYPGTVFYNKLKKEKLLGEGLDYIRLNNDLRGMCSWSEYISNAALRRLSALSMALFYFFQAVFHPVGFFGMVYRVLRKRPAQTNLEMLLRHFLTRGNSNVGSAGVNK
ncbi:MAG TPA: hypothetical protein DCS07_07400 [Bdellovibrionales bacterium]|nr:MAG: hypothetical protein A2X97_11345 [Bdellovibrionales bacterium GWA1_52_35]OFZ40448.1 MAG: hypothetical protein A2070_07425 [Bdellovibrionales bacterium GWC1_52_8]HAR42444.1 hypothetical protein [Bdellovibrionales bacterium]HCM39172.1 hypothetical protein [Bdellovibrionales bacterium]